jgi:type IV pilus assembly protein PilV
MLTMPPTTRAPRPRRSCGGFTLIEVMISILVFSFGVLGTAALQALAVKAQTQNGDRSRAALLANEMVSTLWANQSAAPPPSDLAAWQAKIAGAAAYGLPNATGTVTACAAVANCAVVTVEWKAPSAKASTAFNRFSTTVVIQ